MGSAARTLRRPIVERRNARESLPPSESKTAAGTTVTPNWIHRNRSLGEDDLAGIRKPPSNPTRMAARGMENPDDSNWKPPKL